MTLISLREVVLLQLLEALILLAAGAIALFLMDLRNTRNNAVIQSTHEDQLRSIQTAHETEVRALKEDKFELIKRVNDLDAQLRLLTAMLLNSHTLTPKDASLISSMANPQGLTNRLFTAMELSLSLEDLQVLCHEMGIVYDNLTGTNLDTRIISLIDQATRTGRLDELTEKVRAARPNLKL